MEGGLKLDKRDRERVSNSFARGKHARNAELNVAGTERLNSYLEAPREQFDFDLIAYLLVLSLLQ